MGIPKFFRWLVRRYPCILADIKHENDVQLFWNYFSNLSNKIFITYINFSLLNIFIVPPIGKRLLHRILFLIFII